MDDPHDGSYSRAPDLQDVVKIAEALNSEKARYLLIGGFAVIAHGGGRTTKYIDFLVDPDPQNIAWVKTALGCLADNAAAELDDTDVGQFTVVRIADEVVVDLLAEACGVTYDEAIREADWVDIGSTEIPIADKRTLIRTKQTIRPSDRVDCEFLEARIAEEPTGGA